MIVEHEAIIARDIKKCLTSCGFAIVSVIDNAKDAFQQIEKTSPDIVLVDIRINGEMDGVQAASVIQSCCALPVIYLTSACQFRDTKTRPKNRALRLSREAHREDRHPGRSQLGSP